MLFRSSLVFKFLLFALLANTVGGNQAQSMTPDQKVNALLGSWELREVHWVSPDQIRSNAPSQMGVLIVDAKRYSIMWTTTPTPRVPFKNWANPTDEEKKAAFSSIAFNAGSYELTESTFTTTVQIARVPGFEGAKVFFRYKIKGDTLTLTMFDETYPDGKKPDWSGKMETKLVFKKVK